MSLHHSVRLDAELCRGCTNCLKHCPTEAIRVKGGKASIIEERCIDCGACIRRCPFRAKKAYSEDISAIAGYDYTIALPAPALYGQFPQGTTPDEVLEGLIRLGFDDVLEVAFAAEAVSQATVNYRDSHRDGEALISSSCPAVVRLIRNRFPDLLDQIIPIRSPMEIAARLARKRFSGKGPRLGVFFISPCAAKVTAARDPLGEGKSEVDAVIGIKEIFLPLSEVVSEIRKESESGHPPQVRSEAGYLGVSWARAEGEAEGAGRGETLAADGIQAVVEVLEALEDDRLHDIGFLELMACPGGCVGGPLTVENPYLARARIRGIEDLSRQKVPEARMESAGRSDNSILDETDDTWRFTALTADLNLGFDEEIQPMEVFSLDNDFEKAVEMMAEMDSIADRLPGLDCGSCGSPSCKSLAEDIVKGYARETDCVFRLRDRIRDLTQEMMQLEEMAPRGTSIES